MNKTRIQFELPDDKVRELERLMKEADISTKKELLNNAITILQWVVKERKEGNILASFNETENRLKELVMPILNKIGNQEEQNLEANSQEVTI